MLLWSLRSLQNSVCTVSQVLYSDRAMCTSWSVYKEKQNLCCQPTATSYIYFGVWCKQILWRNTEEGSKIKAITSKIYIHSSGSYCSNMSNTNPNTSVLSVLLTSAPQPDSLLHLLLTQAIFSTYLVVVDFRRSMQKIFHTGETLTDRAQFWGWGSFLAPTGSSTEATKPMGWHCGWPNLHLRRNQPWSSLPTMFRKIQCKQGTPW